MNQEITFARDIRPLFNDRDVSSMSSHFDLSSYDDVRAHAEAIYARLADGSMPCYGAWPPDDVQRFRTWVDGGCAAQISTRLADAILDGFAPDHGAASVPKSRRR